MYTYTYIHPSIHTYIHIYIYIHTRPKEWPFCARMPIVDCLRARYPSSSSSMFQYSPSHPSATPFPSIVCMYVSMTALVTVLDHPLVLEGRVVVLAMVMVYS